MADDFFYFNCASRCRTIEKQFHSNHLSHCRLQMFILGPGLNVHNDSTHSLLFYFFWTFGIGEGEALYKIKKKGNRDRTESNGHMFHFLRVFFLFYASCLDCIVLENKMLPFVRRVGWKLFENFRFRGRFGADLSQNLRYFSSVAYFCILFYFFWLTSYYECELHRMLFNIVNHSWFI